MDIFGWEIIKRPIPSNKFDVFGKKGIMGTVLLPPSFWQFDMLAYPKMGKGTHKCAFFHSVHECMVY
jgi:hypothetical protein